MKTTVKKSLEIPARKHPRKTSNTSKKVVKNKNTKEKSFTLVVNLWIFRYEYSKEQTETPQAK